MASEESYTAKSPAFSQKRGSQWKSKSARPAYLGADESLLLLDFFEDFLWLLFL